MAPLRVPDDERSRVDHLFEGMGIGPDRSFVVIHPGATAPSRRWILRNSLPWPVARLVLDVDMQVDLHRQFPPRRTEVEQIQTAMGVHSFSLAGELDLGELAARSLPWLRS